MGVVITAICALHLIVPILGLIWIANIQQTTKLCEERRRLESITRLLRPKRKNHILGGIR